VSKNPSVDKIVILTRNQKVIESINKNHTNSNYVSGFILPSKIEATSDPNFALKDTNFIIYSVPVQMSLSYLQKLKPNIPPDVPIISSSKGICTETLKMMNSIIPEALGRIPPMAFISGPSFAKELLSDMPTGLVVASTSPPLLETTRKLFSSKNIRVYTTEDIIGVEIGGALKNIFAIAAGVCTGMGLGYNSKAMVVTRGCSEMIKIGLKMGAKPETLAGLSGIGDLMLTCFGALSRNQAVGVRLGRGENIKDILGSLPEVAEGVPTTPAAVKLARSFGLDCPIIEGVNLLLQGNLSVKTILDNLLSLPTGAETDYTSLSKL